MAVAFLWARSVRIPNGATPGEVAGEPFHEGELHAVGGLGLDAAEEPFRHGQVLRLARHIRVDGDGEDGLVHFAVYPISSCSNSATAAKIPKTSFRRLWCRRSPWPPFAEMRMAGPVVRTLAGPDNSGRPIFLALGRQAPVTAGESTARAGSAGTGSSW